MKQKMKMLFMGILFTLFTQNANALDLYVGGTAGVGVFDGSVSVTNSLSPAIGAGSHLRTADTSFVGGGVLGAQETLCGGLYAAAEFNALYNSYDRRVRTTEAFFGAADLGSVSVRVRNDFIYGADFKLGYDCNNIVPYAVIGVSAAKWKTTLENNTAVPIFGALPGDQSFSKTRYGTKLGVGLRFAAWHCWDVDLQYAYTWYGSQARSLPDAIVTVSSWRYRVLHDQHRFLISLNMNFLSL